MSGAAFDAPAIVLVIGSSVLVLLVAVSGSQVLGSANRAKDHLVKAAAMTPQAPASPTTGSALDVRSRAFGAPPTDDASQQIFDQLTQYYAANLSQGQAIFWASFASMVIGFAIIFAGIVTAGANSTTAIVAGVAGVLSQFIAATFLIALRSTQTQSTAYAQTLVELRLRNLRAADDARATALGLQLLSEISGDGAIALVNTTRAALAMGLIVKQTTAPAPAVPPPVPVPADIDVTQRPRTEPQSTARTRAASVSLDETAQTVTPPAPNR
jgi:hypothetical protein